MVTGALRTPLVLQDGVWVKLEYLNPIGRAKDRVAGIALAYWSARLGLRAVTVARRLASVGLSVLTFFPDRIDRYRSLPEFKDL